MGQRGRNRNGHYIALLHVLELQYEREYRVKGADPGEWQPSPQNRPDQFLHWVLNVLESLNFPQPGTLDGVLRQLERGGLHNVAHLLEYLVLNSSGNRDSADPAGRPLDSIFRDFDRPTRSLEKHPQVRKFSKVIVRQLDSDWRSALEATAREFRTVRDLPHAALLLGGLPPSFRVLNDYILGRLADCELVTQHRALTVLQFYGLVTGTLPVAPAQWQPAFAVLEVLSQEDLELLSSLSDRQVTQLRQMSELTWRLLRARLRLRSSSSRWRLLGRSLASGRADDQTVKRLVSTLYRQGMREASEPHLTALASSTAWEVTADVDEELARLVSRGEISQRLVLRLQGWDGDTLSQARELLSEQHDTCLAFLEDRAVMRELFESRTGAHLHLRELFPQTIAWLDAYLSHHLEDAVVNDVGELETAASIVSRRVQDQFWTAMTGRGSFSKSKASHGARPTHGAAQLSASD